MKVTEMEQALAAMSQQVDELQGVLKQNVALQVCPASPYLTRWLCMDCAESCQYGEALQTFVSAQTAPRQLHLTLQQQLLVRVLVPSLKCSTEQNENLTLALMPAGRNPGRSPDALPLQGFRQPFTTRHFFLIRQPVYSS